VFSRQQENRLICLMLQLEECFVEEQAAKTVGDTYSSSTTRRAVVSET